MNRRLITRRRCLQNSTATGMSMIALSRVNWLTRASRWMTDSIDLISEQGSERATSGAGGKLVTFEGMTHVVWQDATDDGKYLNQVRTYDHAADSWSETVTLNEGVDNHARPVVTIDESGTLHVVLSGHGTPVTYRSSTRPNDSTSWSDPERIGSGTYPSLIAGRDGMLHVSVRNPNRWNGVDLYVKHPDRAWRKRCRLVMRDPGLPGYGAFHNGLAWNESQDTLHAVQDFYESKQVSSGRGVYQAVCYMRSRDAGNTWEKADGTPIELPARPESMDILAQDRGDRQQDMPPPILLAQGNIVVDATDRPHILYVSHQNEPGEVMHATIDDRGNWSQRPIRELHDTYPEFRPVSCRGAWTRNENGKLFGLLEVLPLNDRWLNGKPTRELRFEGGDKRLVWLASDNDGESFECHSANIDDRDFEQPNVEKPTGANVISANGFPSYCFFEGLSRYREEGEVIQNRVFLARD